MPAQCFTTNAYRHLIHFIFLRALRMSLTRLLEDEYDPVKENNKSQRARCLIPVKLKRKDDTVGPMLARLTSARCLELDPIQPGGTWQKYKQHIDYKVSSNHRWVNDLKVLGQTDAAGHVNWRQALQQPLHWDGSYLVDYMAAQGYMAGCDYPWLHACQNCYEQMVRTLLSVQQGLPEDR